MAAPNMARNSPKMSGKFTASPKLTSEFGTIGSAVMLLNADRYRDTACRPRAAGNNAYEQPSRRGARERCSEAPLTLWPHGASDVGVGAEGRSRPRAQGCHPSEHREGDLRGDPEGHGPSGSTRRLDRHAHRRADRNVQRPHCRGSEADLTVGIG